MSLYWTMLILFAPAPADEGFGTVAERLDRACLRELLVRSTANDAEVASSRAFTFASNGTENSLAVCAMSFAAVSNTTSGAPS